MTELKSPFEIPADMRRMAEQSVEQARKAFDGFMSAAHKAAAAMEHQAAAAQEGAKDVGQKAVSFAEKNVLSSFEFAQKVVRAKDVQEVMRLQTEFVNAQIKALSEQAQEIGAATTKATMEAARPKGGFSS